MDNFDQSQASRLGQRGSPENPGIQMRTLETLPEVAYRGMQIYLIDVNQTWVYDGEVWQAPASGGGGTGSGRTYVSSVQPVADNVGDQWLNTTDYQLYVWDGAIWQPVLNPLRERETHRAATKLAQAFRMMGRTTGSPTVWYTPTEPSPIFAGDIWVNVVSNVVQQRLLTSWELVGNPYLDLFLAGEVLRHLADFKVQVYFGTPPTDLGPEDIGDVWVTDTVKVWMGATWMDAQITSEELAPGIITEDKLADGAVGQQNIQDFILTARKFHTTKHQLY